MLHVPGSISCIRVAANILGSVTIIATTIAHIASRLDIKTKNVHLRIKGQFHETNEGVSFGRGRFPLGPVVEASISLGTLIPIPELLPDDELVSTLPSSLHKFVEMLLSLSLSMHEIKFTGPISRDMYKLFVFRFKSICNESFRVCE
uniref:Uncharacterized protein n=1 Tax=Glossina brevipalpis TaxID=37001 RepID=A0A1A9W5D3_9MUSC